MFEIKETLEDKSFTVVDYNGFNILVGPETVEYYIERYNWICVDKDGTVSLFSEKPYPDCSYEMWSVVKSLVMDIDTVNYDGDWWDSLIELTPEMFRAVALNLNG